LTGAPGIATMSASGSSDAWLGGDVMLVVEKNGRTTVVSGWRAWLMALGVVLGVVAVVGFLGFIFLSVALTIGAVLLIAVPVAIGFAIVGALFGRRG
jgi:hypothetical protein